MLYTLEIVHDLLSLFDDDGQCHDVVVLTNYDLAQQQVQQWSTQYSFEAATALDELAEYFAQL